MLMSREFVNLTLSAASVARRERFEHTAEALEVLVIELQLEAVRREDSVQSNNQKSTDH